MATETFVCFDTVSQTWTPLFGSCIALALFLFVMSLVIWLPSSKVKSEEGPLRVTRGHAWEWEKKEEEKVHRHRTSTALTTGRSFPLYVRLRSTLSFTSYEHGALPWEDLEALLSPDLIKSKTEQKPMPYLLRYRISPPQKANRERGRERQHYKSFDYSGLKWKRSSAASTPGAPHCT